MLGKPPTNFGMLRYFCNPYVPRLDLTKVQPYNIWYIYNVILGILGGAPADQPILGSINTRNTLGVVKIL